MATLVSEVRSVITLQGDSRYNIHPEAKKQFEQENAYGNSLNSIDVKQHSMLHTLYAGGKLLSKEEVASFTLTAYLI